MNKRFISVLLVVAIVFSAISVLATENNEIIMDISDNNYPAKQNISVNINDLPHIYEGDVQVLPSDNVVSLSSQDTFDEWGEATNTRIPFNSTDSVDVPSNKVASDEEWVSSNEIDNEDAKKINELQQSQLEAFNKKMSSNTTSTRASRNISSVPSDMTERIENINSKDSFALQNQTSRTNFVGDNIGEEYIDTLTGNLVVTETDLILPGVDGLDLNLSRYYSLAQSEVYTKTAKLNTNTKTYTLPEGMYVVEEEVFNTETNVTTYYSYPYSRRADAISRVNEILSRDTCDNLYMYNALWRESVAGETITFNYHLDSEITSSNYQTIRNNLGVGWSWSFPSVQPIKNNYLDENEMPSAIYYHDGKGNVLEVEEGALNGYKFKNYEGGDIIFDVLYYYDTSICSNSRLDYMVEDGDGIKYYFGPHGEIRTIVDMYGNKIQFVYTTMDFYGAENVPVISGITDTVGRQVSFAYTSNDDYDAITLTITSPATNEDTLTMTYKKKMIDFEYDNELLSSEPFLESVEYANGDTTTYYPADMGDGREYAQPIIYTFADKSFTSEYVYNTSGYSNNFVYLLGNIVRPHSNTYYEYDLCERNLGHSGISQAYRIAQRSDNLLVVNSLNDIMDFHRNNVVEYRYSLDYTGYPYFVSTESAQDGEYICRTTKEYDNGSIYRKEFYKHEESVLGKNENFSYVNPVGNTLNVIKSVESYLSKTPLLTKVTYNNNVGYTYNSYLYNLISGLDDRTYGKPLLQTKEISYETINDTDLAKQGIEYTYNDKGFIKSKSWYKNNNEKCTERYVYNSKNRISKVINADDIETSYLYTYTNGKVSKKTTTMTDTDDTTKIEEIYTAQTGYAYPSTVTKIVTNQGETTQDTTTYTYNMLLGVVKTSTDTNGNTTYYEYDEIGRPTRIIYPKYYTYSQAGVKGIEILPVETYEYKQVKRDYDDVLYEGEQLIVQELYSRVIYYDVTDVTVSNPTTLDFTAIPATAYSAKTEYYLGTGELIESNVLENANGTDVVNTVNYYYDSANNTVKEVDTKGNSTTVQYDGLGREVKTIDKFDNYHIMEYNISGIGVGFKGMSYFVPASDRQSKENITEYTYDRHERMTNEKIYAEYPNTFVESKYEYDFVDNVIAITDANNNLNEDGYTQTNTYDKLNRLITSKNANNEVITNVYDVFGNVTMQTITDSNGKESVLYQHTYTPDGKIITDRDNAQNSNMYTYDAMGRLTRTVDKDSKIHNNQYNELSDCDMQSHIKEEESVITKNYSYTTPYGAGTVYDIRGVYNEENNNYSAYINELSSYGYSKTGKPMYQKNIYTHPTGVANLAFIPLFRYNYDSEGNVVSSSNGVVYEEDNITFGATTLYEYDKNRISKIQTNGSSTRNTDNSVNARYEFYEDGKLKSVTYPTLTDGEELKSVYTYDGLSRLSNLVNYKGTNIISSYSYTYDNNGNILTTTQTVGEKTDNVNYTYDKLNRISSVYGSKGADSYYEYDMCGNRKVNYEQIDFISEENAEFRYNEEDKLYYANVGNNTTSIDYSANGYRYVKQENLAYPEFYVYDNDGRLHSIAEPVYITSGGEQKIVMYPVIQYIWGPDRVLVKTDVLANEQYYYLYNGHGDVVQIVDVSGNVVNSYDYDVWGNFLRKEETIENHFTYFGQTYDEATGLYYLRARYYDPTIGRFISEDPIKDSYNWYVYGNNNPVMFVDPSGENWIYNAWNWSEDAAWKGIALGVSAVGWKLSADLLRLAASGSGNTYTATSGSYASNLAKNDTGINKKVNDIIWDYGTSRGKNYISTPKISYEIPLGNGDLGAALHWVDIQVKATRRKNGSWYANVTITDDFDFTEFKNPFTQGSVLKGMLWAANDIAYFDTKWGLLDNVGVVIKYNRNY